MFRKLTKADLQRILQIENTVSVVPWGVDAFRMCFEAGHNGWVLEDAGQVMGFIIFSLKAEECHILNICVDRPHQRRGLGRQLLEKALLQAQAQAIGVAYLEVRRSNTGAIALYQQLAFRQVGVRKDYYPTVSGNEDALVFARSLVGG